MFVVAEKFPIESYLHSRTSRFMYYIVLHKFYGFLLNLTPRQSNSRQSH